MTLQPRREVAMTLRPLNETAKHRQEVAMTLQPPGEVTKVHAGGPEDSTSTPHRCRRSQ